MSFLSPKPPAPAARSETEAGARAPSYSELCPQRISETLAHLEERIQGSFPDSGLGRVTAEMQRLAAEAGPTAGWLRRPLWPLRIAAILGVVALCAIAFGVARIAHAVPLQITGLAELIQATEAAANEIVLLSLGLFFLCSLETRWKRSRALAALHRLRSIVHVVDMHQLTKDPQRLLAPGPGEADPRYTRLALARYLDFCSELLSAASKLAALHVQYLNDPVVLAAVNDIEALAGNLSNKIWQKIMILDVMAPGTRSRLERTPQACASNFRPPRRRRAPHRSPGLHRVAEGAPLQTPSRAGWETPLT